jgi:HlyD family secretion protein
VQFYKDVLTKQNRNPNSLTDANISKLNTYTGKVNSYLTSLLSITDTIQSEKESLIETDFEIADQKIKVIQAEDALEDAEENLANCHIYAPLAGTVANMDVKKGDSVSANSAIATVVPKQMVAEISLNEVDIAKVAIGQKAVLTFDAIDGLSVAGEVVEVDIIGTATQGVVVYNVKISLSGEDGRVKPGMSVSTSIITETKQDVLSVPNAAVKSNGESYVQVLENGIVRDQTVEIGLSDDAMTEITSGLQEGDEVITQTIAGSSIAGAAASSKSSETGFKMMDIGGGPRQ